MIFPEAIDTGGTFTDLLVADPRRGLSMHKVSTTPADPAAGVIDGPTVAAEAAGQPLEAFPAASDLPADGAVVSTLDEVEAVIRGFDARGVEAVAVRLLWSIVDPAHELAVGRPIAWLRPDLPYTLSHRVAAPPKLPISATASVAWRRLDVGLMRKT